MTNLTKVFKFICKLRESQKPHHKVRISVIVLFTQSHQFILNYQPKIYYLKYAFKKIVSTVLRWFSNETEIQEKL